MAYGAGRTSDRARKQEKAQHETTAPATPQPDAAAKSAEAPATAPATLEATFAVAKAESIETEDGVSAAVGPIEVVVARIGPDGKPVMACVDDLEAARRFRKAPSEQQAPKQAKEQ
jgi:hypothetical protein